MPEIPSPLIQILSYVWNVNVPQGDLQDDVDSWLSMQPDWFELFPIQLDAAIRDASIPPAEYRQLTQDDNIATADDVANSLKSLWFAYYGMDYPRLPEVPSDTEA